ncbi:hypothetical protein DFH29DRAFT_1084226 [Suillus ampliporus]|nr:hypothetical protein DFH29DRAFT_1084226 [Suillus ampliporus]
MVSSLRNTGAVDLASKFYDELEQLRAPRFANCRLCLPCITFPVTEVRRRHGLAQETHLMYDVKADGLHDLLVTTEEKLIQFPRARPTRQTFLLVRPWDCCLLELPDFLEQPAFTDDAESDDAGSDDDYWPVPGSPLGKSLGDPSVEQKPADSESRSY